MRAGSRRRVSECDRAHLLRRIPRRNFRIACPGRQALEIKKGLLVNKAQLIDSIADGTGVSKAVAEKMLDVTIESITRTLKDGDPVAIVGFGTFKVSARAARSGRNPRTGETIDIAAAKVPKFSAGKALKDAIN